MTLRVAVFASGGGSNLQSLIDRFNKRDAADDIRVVLVVSDREGALALDRARAAGIDAVVIPVSGRPSDVVAHETLAALENSDVDLIALAGYLRLIPPAIVRRYHGRIVNIHPALLPAFGGKGMYGMSVHRAVIDSGCGVSGATVHYVDEKYDEGRIIAQWPVPVLRNDTPETLAARVLEVEHLLYPAAIELVARALRNRGEQPDTKREFCFVQTPNAAPSEEELRHALGID